MNRRTLLVPLLALGYLACGYSCPVLKNAPKPGILGAARYDRDDNSTNEYVKFISSAPEAEIRASFERYCVQRGLTKSARDSPFGTVWYESKQELLGVYLFQDKGAKMIHVRYWHSADE